MATFTMALKDVIDETHGDIGLGDYHIFDEAYREPLNSKIKDHFWNREIGMETIDLFTFAMRRKMNEIMPIYNQLYESQLLEVDPLLTFRSTSQTISAATTSATGTATAEATQATSSTEATLVEGSASSVGTTGQESSGKTRNVSSELPQTRLSPDGEYATSAVDVVSQSLGSGTSNETSETGQESSSTATGSGETADSSSSTQAGEQSAESDSTSSGFSGSMSSLLLEYRATFLNIDMLIIGELQELFMLVWSNGDSFTPGYGY